MGQYNLPPDIAKYIAGLGSRLASVERILPGVHQPLVLSSPWENYGGGNYTAHYSIDATGFVRVTGLVRLPGATKYAYNGANATVATLPEPFRPAGTVYFSQFTNTGVVKLLVSVNVNAEGRILIGEGASETANEGLCAYLTLAGIGFYAGFG